MALNGLFCADVLLRNYSLTHSSRNIIAYVKDISFYNRIQCCFYISLIALILTSILTLLLIHTLTAFK